ncbi:MAG: hypothetical protein PQJ46_17315 [Spirochaetales bacterium]|nr:hypothetical protein [Spirochaetales bacterium]
MNNKEIMKQRASLLADIRSFFNRNNYIEADVPILTKGVIPESSIELFKTEQKRPYGSPEELYLLPSPEYYLKKLISDGSGDLFCISHSFRNSEQNGNWHNPEFSMLEYYAMDADYKASIKITENLFESLTINTKNLKPPFRQMTMDEAFKSFSGFDLSNHCTGKLSPEEERAQLRDLAMSFKLSVSKDDSWEELFNLIFVHKIEPNLPQDKPLVLLDYPKGVPALATPAKQEGRLERWELYAGGIELANCYSEETDYNRVKSFFKTEEEDKKDALVKVKSDLNWCEMYKKDFPKCSGTALGIDRLLMLLSDSKSIGGVILFPLSDILDNL